jgi:hypothetical protein
MAGVFWLRRCHDRASTRGEMTLRGLYVFSHGDRFGSAPAQSLFDRIKITPVGHQSPRSYADYQIDLPDNGELPPGGSPCFSLRMTTPAGAWVRHQPDPGQVRYQSWSTSTTPAASGTDPPR